LKVEDENWAYLLRVGADSTYYGGGFHGPIFDGFFFEFIPIPEREATESYRKSSYGKFTYGNTVDRKRDHPLTYYIEDERIRENLRNMSMHPDPDFGNATYGDIVKVRAEKGHQLKNVSKAASLRYLKPGNIVVFCASLDPFKTTRCQRALYMIGYMEVEEKYDFQNMSEDERWAKCRKFKGRNCHFASAGRDQMKTDEFRYLIIVEGKPGKSTLLDKAVQLTDEEYRVLPKWSKELGLNSTPFFRGGRWLPQKDRDRKQKRRTYVEKLRKVLKEQGICYQSLRGK
jgi:hypothetical protein